MGILTTVLINDWVTCFVHSLNVVEPNSSCTFFVQSFVQTLLSQVFKYDFSTLNRKVWWLNSAVLTTTITIRFNVPLVTANTLPEDIVGREDNIFTKFLLEGFKVFDEIIGTVWAWCHPEVVLYFVSSFECHYKFSHYHKLLLFCRCSIFQPFK